MMKLKKGLDLSIPLWWPSLPSSSRLRSLLPLVSSIVVTVLTVATLFCAKSVGALAAAITAESAAVNSGTIAYQGQLADSDGNPITETVNMEFRLYDVAEGGTSLWSELWTGSNAVRVSDGLFNVMLGSLEPIPQEAVAGHDQLYLGTLP